jgi:hypothetical protein
LSSPPERLGPLRRGLRIALLAAPLAAPIALAAPGPSRAPLAAAAVEAAASAVRADPDMAGIRQVRTWRFKRDDTDRPSPSPDPWMLDFARWIAEGGRLFVWLGGAAALAALLVGARRWLALRGEIAPGAEARLPSHVRELDIRPENLPSDVGAAVRAAWLAGDRRAALSLLYRGALSRLVHSLAVPIEDASTEGDCVRLAHAALPAERSAFVARLVLAWQVAVYGNRAVDTATVLSLCDEFDLMLPRGAAPLAALP